MSRMTVLALALGLIPASTLAAGDPVAGERKAAQCIACHGSANFPGMFPLVQLAGRDADKMVIKINRYRSGKLFSPLMNMSVMALSDQDVEDIAAWYNKLGKPALAIAGIRGDEDTADR